MTAPQTPQTTRPAASRLPLLASCCLAAGLLGSTAAALRSDAMAQALRPPPALLVAPMLSGLDVCLQNRPARTPAAEAPLECLGPEGSGAALVQATLATLEPVKSPDLTLGYSLKAPLLDFLRREGDQWRVDTDAVRRLANTVEGVPRPVVLYLFSTHFETHAPIETELAADPANRATGPTGPLPVDRYYEDRLYPWSVASTTNSLTQRREQVMAAIAAEFCRRPAPVRERIAAITLLGEVHQLFPHFETGMAFTGPYEVSDYSEASRAGFQHHLAQHVRSLEALNAQLGTAYRRWADVHPPAGSPAAAPEQFIDAYAHGTLPVSGWVAPPTDRSLGAGTVWVYLDGQLQGRSPVGLNRQDVLAALPALGSADVGWRFDLDFRRLAPGEHQIDLYLHRTGQADQHLGRRQIVIEPPVGTQPLAAPADFRFTPLMRRPPAAKAPPTLRYSIDAPPPGGARYRYNPLVPLWHAYRNQQVVDYLQHFRQRLAGTCLGERPLYTHQLVPYANPSWDANKYAVDASLQPQPGLHLGISLYGETTYGTSLIQWLHGQRQTHYGVTEFHPLKALTPGELAATFGQHHVAGARFVSMFLEGRWQGRYMAEQRNLFGFDPANPSFGSDVLHASLKAVLARPEPWPTLPRTAAGARP